MILVFIKYFVDNIHTQVLQVLKLSSHMVPIPFPLLRKYNQEQNNDALAS